MNHDSSTKLDELELFDNTIYTTYIYTDTADRSIISAIKDCIPSIDFIIRNDEDWNIRYITGIIMDPNVKVLVIHNINEISVAEIALASFMCKTILCTTENIREYPKICNLVTEIQTGCNLNINNNSFIHWYNSKRL